MKTTVYLAFSVTAANQVSDAIKAIITFLENSGNYVVYRPEKLLTYDYIISRVIKNLDASDVVIADVSHASHGVGFEIGYAYSKRKKIILIAKDSMKNSISKFITTLGKHIIYYNDINILINNISHCLEDYDMKFKYSNESVCPRKYKVIELCAGAGGQSLGLEMAGFEHRALIDNDSDCCKTLALNRPSWNIINADLNDILSSSYTALSLREYKNIDLLAGGLPCPPFSIAGKQYGEKDERNLFPAALKIADYLQPKAIMIENVSGLINNSFKHYREVIDMELIKLNYYPIWKLINVKDFGVSQFRQRVVLIALRNEYKNQFYWPLPESAPPKSIGDLLIDIMAGNNWKHADTWKAGANNIAPTIVGGSKKHGGADLGPTRAKKDWLKLGVDGSGIADESPRENFEGNPRLTLQMVARIQGFPDYWKFFGKKTSIYRQIGNAFPPPVACSIGKQIIMCLHNSD